MLFTIQKKKAILLLLLKIEILMSKKKKGYQTSVDLAIENAKKRINLLDKKEQKCIFEEYKEWIQEDINYHSILLIREDPII